MATILIKDKISPDLALRDYAKTFFRDLQSLPDDKITIDFTNVLSISRSFAHEYLLNKENIKKDIIEINMPQNVAKMFRIVKDHSIRPKLIDPDNTQVITL